MKKYYLLQGQKFRLDGGAMFGIIPKPLWNKVSPSDDRNRIDLALRTLIIQFDDRVLAVDMGVGDYHDQQFCDRFDVRGVKNSIGVALEKIGLKKSDITDIVGSHYHFDHVGGISEVDENSGEVFPTFPNATLHLHKLHYKHALNPTERDAGSFQSKIFEPVVNYYKNKKKLNWYEGEEGILIESKEGDIKYMMSHGHSPYLTHIYDENIFHVSDLIPTLAHLKTAWVMGYDLYPVTTVKEKVDILKFIDSNKLMAFFEHDPLDYGIYLNQDGKIKEQFNSSDIACEILKG